MDSNRLIQRLTELKAQIARDEKQHAELIGQQKGLNKSLQDTYACETIEAAEEKLEALAAEEQDLNNEIVKGLAEIEAALRV